MGEGTARIVRGLEATVAVRSPAEFEAGTRSERAFQSGPSPAEGGGSHHPGTPPAPAANEPPTIKSLIALGLLPTGALLTLLWWGVLAFAAVKVLGGIV